MGDGDGDGLEARAVRTAGAASSGADGLGGAHRKGDGLEAQALRLRPSRAPAQGLEATARAPAPSASRPCAGFGDGAGADTRAVRRSGHSGPRRRPMGDGEGDADGLAEGLTEGLEARAVRTAGAAGGATAKASPTASRPGAARRPERRASAARRPGRCAPRE